MVHAAPNKIYHFKKSLILQKMVYTQRAMLELGKSNSFTIKFGRFRF